VTFPNARLNQPKKTASGPRLFFRGRNNSADKAGLRVSALNAENSTEMAMVTANC